ncbi:MAG: hypothetical protein MUO87_04235 [Thermoplasmata archaeon]|nr:hypothetical protein [Thermoplasmata archaeon]
MAKKIDDLRNAEEKFRALLNKRDDINAQASAIRSERDMLNDQRRELQEQVREVRDKRDALVAEMRAYKDRRNDLQRKAKELIEFKGKLKGRPMGDLNSEIRKLSGEIENLDLTQQTVPMTIPKERKLLDDLKAKRQELERVRTILGDQEKIVEEINDIDQSIDELFRQADKEHEEVVRLSNESQEHHDRVTSVMKDISSLKGVADKKHTDFVKLREDADAAHQKATDMRDKIIDIRKERRASWQEEQDAVNEVNKAARDIFDDEKRKDAAAEEALQLLLNKKKVEMR